MGMFDYVKWRQEPCPACGKPLTTWQTKDAECWCELLSPEDLDEKGVTAVHNMCLYCNQWVEYRRKPVAYSEWGRVCPEEE